ncbi:hypothetical protein [Actinomyces faecalis]|nr:hypothetical protein [Actinomyces faecalis]
MSTQDVSSVVSTVCDVIQTGVIIAGVIIGVSGRRRGRHRKDD